MVGPDFDHEPDSALTKLGGVRAGSCHESESSNESALRTHRGGSLGGLAVAALCAGTARFGCAVTVGSAGGALGGVLGGAALGGEAYGDYALNGAIGGAIGGLPFGAIRGVLDKGKGRYMVIRMRIEST